MVEVLNILQLLQKDSNKAKRVSLYCANKYFFVYLHRLFLRVYHVILKEEARAGFSSLENDTTCNDLNSSAPPIGQSPSQAGPPADQILISPSLALSGEGRAAQRGHVLHAAASSFPSSNILDGRGKEPCMYREHTYVQWVEQSQTG